MDSYKGEKIRDLIISVILLIIGFVVGISQGQPFYGALIWGTIFGGVCYAWKILTFITPNIFVIMPIIGWIIYLVVKLILAIFIAPFAFIIKTVINIFALLSN